MTTEKCLNNSCERRGFLFIQKISSGHGVEDGRIQPTAKSRRRMDQPPARVVDPRHSASPSPCPSFITTPVAPSSTGASTRPDSPIATPILCASFLGIRVRLTNLTITCSQGKDARYMNMEVLRVLEQSSIFNEVFKDQMDRTREQLSPVAVAAPNCSDNEAEATREAVWASRLRTRKTHPRGE